MRLIQMAKQIKNFDEDLKLNPELFFNREELAETFHFARSTVAKMIRGIPHAGVRDRGLVWHIADVTMLINQQLEREVTASPVEANPDRMSPKERLTYYRAEDSKQSALLKKLKNDLGSGDLIPVNEVEQVLATAFKTVVLMLDTLPDALERDGMLASDNVERVTVLIDAFRYKLAVQLADLSADTS
jgi:phage terminase Nu1 subunit (DNA packaging protein)